MQINQPSIIFAGEHLLNHCAMNLHIDISFLSGRDLPIKTGRGIKPHPNGKGAELQRRKYGAKEYLSEFSLAEYDFDARRLITSTGTFSQPDPLAGALTHPETGKRLGMPYLASFSPYSYCAGDPINFIDDKKGAIWETGTTPLHLKFEIRSDTVSGIKSVTVFKMHLGTANNAIFHFYNY